MAWVSILFAAADSHVIDRVHDALTDTWSTRPQVPPAIRMQVDTALAEIVANIVKHGPAGLQIVNLEVQIAVEPGRVRIAVIDDGNDLPAGLPAASMPGPESERGRGLAMAQSLLDNLTYRRRGGRNCWLLVSKPF